MKVLVTGAAGFIGAYVCRVLAQKGEEVVGVDSVNDYYDVTLKTNRLKWLQESANIEFEKLDLADRSSVSKLFEKGQFDRVIHLAAQAGVRYSIENPHAYVDSNVVAFVNILEACRHHSIQHLVYASSSSVYGLNSKMPYSTSDHVDHPVSLYAATKKSNELMAHTYSHLYGLPTTGLRFFTVYGPWGRPDMAYFSFTKAILEGKPINIFNHGNMKRDFTFIEDIVEGVVRVVDKAPSPDSQWTPESGASQNSSAPYKIYNIGNHSPVKLGEFVSTLEMAIGKEAEKVYLPMQPGDVVATYADVDDLQRDIGFTPATSLKSGLEKFVLWYRQYYNH